MKVSADTQRRLRMSAVRTAEAYGMADQAEALLERKMDRQKSQLGRIAENMKQSAGAVFAMFQLALRNDDESAALRDKAFYALPLDAQRMLIDNAIKAAERADEYAASERNMTDSEYDRILMSVMKTVKDLRNVCGAPKFVTALRVRDAATALM
jgi:antirestriction protein ArdC